MTQYILFTLDGFHNRLVSAWSLGDAKAGEIRRIVSWRTACRKHARLHGRASAWHADDSLSVFYFDGKKVRSTTFPHARPLEQGEFDQLVPERNQG